MTNTVSNPGAREWATIEQDAPGYSPAILAERIGAARMLPWVKLFLQLTQKSQTVLDLGSGTGHVSALLAAHGRRPTLVDFSRENLDFSRALFERLGLEARFVHGDITRPLPFEAGSFDVVICCSVLQFFTDEQLRHLRQEALRLARRRVIFSAPNALCLAYRLGRRHLVKSGRWHWPTERCFRTLRPVLCPDGDGPFREFTVGPRHGLNFLTMPGGPLLRKLLSLAGVADRPTPAALAQGYMRVAVLDKESGPSA